MRALYLSFLFLMFIPAAFARVPFLPIDEATKDPSFQSFRVSLLGAVEAKNVVALKQHIDPKILFSFGGDSGRENFNRSWRLERPSTSLLWRELKQVLVLGGSFTGGEFFAPYVYSAWPDSYDAFEHIAVTASGLNIRERPSTRSPVIGRASWEILKRNPQGEEVEGWEPVIMKDGKPGYVSTLYTRSPVSYRAIFHKVNGKWMMRVFIAGD